jgi:hypothetical protein
VTFSVKLHKLQQTGPSAGGELRPLGLAMKSADLWQGKTARLTNQPIGTWLQPVKLSGARERVMKKTYIRLPKFPLAALDKAFGECKADKSWTVLENTTSGHSVMITEPEWLTGILLQAV